MSHAQTSPLSVRLIGGPTVLIDIAGLRFLTDPTFDPPRTFERDGVIAVTKIKGPAVSAEELGPVDAVLLSHDQHPDNLDESGRAYLSRIPQVLTTHDGAERLADGAQGLQPWDTTTVSNAHGETVRITALPAQHGPGPDAEKVNGTVIGFLLSAPDGRSIYISGDNASVDVVRQIVQRAGRPDVAVLFMGGASLPFLFDGEFVTLDAPRAAEAAGLLGANAVVPVHLNGWSHYTDTESEVTQAFAAAGRSDQLHVLMPGQTFEW
ncbi:MBL fold metallo-hydrolase [Streptomyces sp. Isolate_219]|uniref:MBL fold metallo-hydrolase n=1 Tax=Streptomyces sp. Isolate_219 TaxID=2950110 RepID=UPI0021C739B3|nr:MBL fold metallo-hydrolase [Streptomyces sp. Isolate_219]MCR8576332.1 MBL fold metallo-hydrolase [Streptomyces sp. Isolate_219]